MTTPSPFWNALFKDYSDGSGVYISSVNGGGGKYIAGNAYYYNSTLWRSDKTVASAINLDNGTVVFYTNSGLTANTDFTPTERMRITSAGNVGIGTTSPTSRLELAGYYVASSISNVGANSLFTLDTTVNTGINLKAGITSSYNAYIQGYNSQNVSSISLVLNPFGGNVGIGMTSPTTKLEIFGNNSARNTLQNILSINGGTSSNNVYSGFGMGLNFNGRDYSNQPRDYAYIYGVQETSSTSTPGGDPGFTSQLTFYTNTGGAVNTLPTQKMVITAAGNVGIGTTSPQNDKLHVETDTSTVYDGNSNQTGGLFVNNMYHEALNTFSQIRLGVSGASGASTVRLVGIEPSEAASDFAVVLRNGSNWGEKLRIKGATGNVGIGTVSPTTTLSVQGTTNNGINVIGVGTTATRCYLGLNSANKGYLFITGSSGENPAVITSQGNSYISTNLGIGTTTVQNKFVVRDTGSAFNSTIQTSTVSIISKEMTDNAYHSILQLVAVRQSLTTGNASNGYLGFSTVDDSNNQGQLDAGRIAIVNEVGSSRNSATALSFWTNPGGTQTTAAVEKMRITSAGRILMPGLDGKTQVHPDVSYRTSDGEIFYQSSSRRYKTDIVNLESSLDKINLLRPVRFKDINTSEPAFGMIAEETFEVIPDVVFTKKIDGFDEPQIEGLSYSNLVPFLIKAIQELKAEIEILKNK
jgi:hypothetical protein